jgi:hypothetical protein
MARGPFATLEEWMDDKRAEIDSRERQLKYATDARVRQRLERGIARYRALLTMGLEGAIKAAERAKATRAL